MNQKIENLSGLVSLVPPVSIVLLNWNGGKYVDSCIQSVLEQDYPDIQLIVVDNGSNDHSVEIIRKNYPQLNLLVNDVNLGFAKGMNQGIQASRGAYVLPLNMDVVLDKGYVTAAVTALNFDSRMGAVGGAIYALIDGKKTMMPHHGETGGLLLRKRFQGLEAGGINEAKYVLGVTGSCPVLRRSMLDDIQRATGDYYDELYFSGWEDLDLWLRLQLRGWTCKFIPDAIAWHEGSGSVEGRDRLISKPQWYQVHILKNRYITMIKDLPPEVLVRLMPFLAVIEIGLFPYFLLTSRSTALALLKAWWQVSTLLPELLQKRKRVQSTRVVPSNYLWKFFAAF